MPDIFVDTGGWFCFLGKSEARHAAATTFIGVCLAQHGRLVTTNYVMAELVALLTTRRIMTRPQFHPVLQGLRSSPYLTIIHIDPGLDQSAWDLLAARLDKA